jgi:hypothetical protein
LIDPAKEAPEKVKIAVIPRSAATRNLSFCEHLNQEGSLASLGMTALILFSATCKGIDRRSLRVEFMQLRAFGII